MMAVAEWRAKDRQLSSWVAGFLEYTDGIQSPELFRRWAAICAIAGALERKVWIRSQGRDVFPNLYVLLVGPPGAGKTAAVSLAEGLWKTLAEHKVAETSLTKASLVDRLSESTRIIRHPIQMEFNALLVASKEFGALVPQYDPDFLNALTYFWDCERYDEKRRYGKNNGEALIIERPCLNLIGCTTPSYLIGTMPPFAWDQGFFARVIIAYSDISEIVPLDLADEGGGRDQALHNALASDIKLIGERAGRMKFTAPAVKLIESWNLEHGPKSRPSHPRLMNYNTRRTLQLLKLCMIAAADRGVEVIDIPDFQAADAWLKEVESVMHEVFVAMQSGGDAHVINECWHYVLTYNARHSGGCPVHLVYTFLQGRAPSTAIQKIYETMLNSGMLRVSRDKGVDLVTAKPR